MMKCDAVPTLPPDMASLEGEEQARALLRAWTTLTGRFALCASKHGALVQWIEAGE